MAARSRRLSGIMNICVIAAEQRRGPMGVDGWRGGMGVGVGWVGGGAGGGGPSGRGAT